MKLVDERDRKDEVGDDDKLSIYRHQAATVQRKKATIAERLQESRRELEQLQQAVRTKRTEMRDQQGNEVITSVQVCSGFRFETRICLNSWNQPQP